MIDFKNANYIKLKTADNNTYSSIITPVLTSGEHILATYQAMRDGIVFTNKRLITINIQGVTGKKKDITSLPFNKIQAFSIETAGVLDLDSELEIWFSGLGKVKLEFTAKSNVHQICKLIGSFSL